MRIAKAEWSPQLERYRDCYEQVPQQNMAWRGKHLFIHNLDTDIDDTPLFNIIHIASGMSVTILWRIRDLPSAIEIAQEFDNLDIDWSEVRRWAHLRHSDKISSHDTDGFASVAKFQSYVYQYRQGEEHHE